MSVFQSGNLGYIRDVPITTVIWSADHKGAMLSGPFTVHGINYTLVANIQLVIKNDVEAAAVDFLVKDSTNTTIGATTVMRASVYSFIPG